MTGRSCSFTMRLTPEGSRTASVLSQKFVHKFDAIHAGFPTVAAVYDRRFSLQHAIKPAVIDRRYSGKMVPENVSGLRTQDTSPYALFGAAFVALRDHLDCEDLVESLVVRYA